MELLFESRVNLGHFTGDLNFVQRKPALHPEPVLRPDTDADGDGVSIYGSVLNDGGRLRMWYYARPRDIGAEVEGVCAVAYAESDDGIQWKKPALGLVDYGRGPNHLTNLGMQGGTVFIDPDSHPSHRYRATGYGYRGLFLCRPEIDPVGYYTAHSADGLDWKLDSPTPRWPSYDVISSIYHPGRRCGVTALKFLRRWMRMGRRSIHTAEFRDGVYSDHVTALYPDEFDDVCAVASGYHSCDYYGIGMQGAGQGTVGFLCKYWHALPYTGPGACQTALYGTADITLVYQPDRGGRWFHVPGRPIFIDHTELPWTQGWISSAANVTEVGDEHRLYLSGRSYSHGFGITGGAAAAGGDWKADSRWTAYAKKHGVSGITFASWPKWRLFGFESNPEGAFIIRLGRIEQPSEIRLNYEITRPEGRMLAEVRTEIEDGGAVIRAFDDCMPLTRGSLGEAVAWKTGAMIPAAPSAELHLRLEHARIYAYELRPLKG